MVQLKYKKPFNYLEVNCMKHLGKLREVPSSYYLKTQPNANKRNANVFISKLDRCVKLMLNIVLVKSGIFYGYMSISWSNCCF